MRFGKMKSLIGLVALCCACCFFIALGSSDALAGKWKRESQAHEAECNQWCAEHKDVCSHCSTLGGCGSGYDTLRSWTGYGKNWHACAKRISSSDQNKAACEKYCNSKWGKENGCVKCASHKGCGAGYDKIEDKRAFDNAGPGKWYACQKRLSREEESARNKAACEEACSRIRKHGARELGVNKGNCRHCSRFPNCGKGYERVRTHLGHKAEGFKGRGTNYYLCQTRISRDEAGDLNQKKCEDWCKEEDGEYWRDDCKYCSDKPSGCKSFELLEAFTGRGKNWYACGTKR